MVYKWYILPIGGIIWYRSHLIKGNQETTVGIRKETCPFGKAMLFKVSSEMFRCSFEEGDFRALRVWQVFFLSQTKKHMKPMFAESHTRKFCNGCLRVDWMNVFWDHLYMYVYVFVVLAVSTYMLKEVALKVGGWLDLVHQDTTTSSPTWSPWVFSPAGGSTASKVTLIQWW